MQSTTTSGRQSRVAMLAAPALAVANFSICISARLQRKNLSSRCGGACSGTFRSAIGEIVEHGKYVDLLRAKGQYYRLYTRAFEEDAAEAM